MRLRLLRLLAALFALTLVAAACGDDSDSDDEASGDSGDSGESVECDPDGDMVDLGGREVTIAVENAYLPFNYIDAETGEAAGWDYDALDDMAERLNFVPVYETFAWEPMIQAVADGQFDMAADGITINDERAEIVDFSDGYINIEQRMLVRVGEDRFADADELAADDLLELGPQRVVDVVVPPELLHHLPLLEAEACCLGIRLLTHVVLRSSLSDGRRHPTTPAHPAVPRPGRRTATCAPT